MTIESSNSMISLGTNYINRIFREETVHFAPHIREVDVAANSSLKYILALGASASIVDNGEVLGVNFIPNPKGPELLKWWIATGTTKDYEPRAIFQLEGSNMIHVAQPFDRAFPITSIIAQGNQVLSSFFQTVQTTRNYAMAQIVQFEAGLRQELAAMSQGKDVPLSELGLLTWNCEDLLVKSLTNRSGSGGIGFMMDRQKMVHEEMEPFAKEIPSGDLPPFSILSELDGSFYLQDDNNLNSGDCFLSTMNPNAYYMVREVDSDGRIRVSLEMVGIRESRGIRYYHGDEVDQYYLDLDGLKALLGIPNFSTLNVSRFKSRDLSQVLDKMKKSKKAYIPSSLVKAFVVGMNESIELKNAKAEMKVSS